MKIAVIGTGPAGYGVLSALQKKKEKLEVTVFDINKELQLPKLEKETSTKTIKDFYSNIYKQIREKNGFKFPPPKTHFAKSLAKYPVGGKPKVFKSENIGGLSNYWGATSVPFTPADFEGWPVGCIEMDKYYQQISSEIGISGQSDSLDYYFGNKYINKPPLKINATLQKLNNLVKERYSQTDNTQKYKLISGINRCAIETEANTDKTCIYCGECLAGCFKNSIYSTASDVRKIIENNGWKLVSGKVRKFLQNNTLEIETETNTFQTEIFDKIYIAAGCPNTSEIVMRSLNLTEVEDIQDNAVYVFPIMYFGKTQSKFQHEYVSLNNLILGLVPENQKDTFAEILLYTNFDYMWHYNIPPFLWKICSPFVRWSRKRIFWARMYVHGKHSQSYKVKLQNDLLTFEEGKKANKEIIPELMKSLRKQLNTKGFWIPPISPLLQKSNSHYASTIPYGGKIIGNSVYGEVSKNVYLCDSAFFPHLPATSLTFTIMANACRIASETV